MAVLKRKYWRALFSCSLPVMAVFAYTLLPGMARAAGDDIKVGVAAAVNQDAEAKPPQRPFRRLYLGDNLVFNETVKTGPRGLTQILLADRSALTVGSNSTLVIDKFVYDPDADKGKMALSMAKGVVRFVGGALSKKRGQVTLKTPSATIGIRGAVVLVQVLPGGVRFIMSFGREVLVNGPDGTRQRITAPGYAVFVPTGGNPQQPEPVTQDEINLIQSRLAGRPDANGGTTSPPTGEQINGSDIARNGSGNSSLDLAGTSPPVRQEQSDTPLTEDSQRNAINPIPQGISAGRLQLSGSDYLINGSGPIQPSGTTTDSAGLLGGTTDSSAEQVLSNINFSATALTATLSGGGSITLPFDAAGSGVAVTASNSSSPFGDLSGIGLFYRDSSGNLEFGYYDLRESSDMLPAFLFFGSSYPTASQTALPQIISFALLQDPIQAADFGNPLPFVAGQAFSGVVLSSGGIASPLYYIEQNDGTVGATSSDGSVSAFLQSSIYLEGTGSTQKSSLAVVQGQLSREAGFNTPIAESNRRGGGRIGNTDTFAYDGVIRTLDDGGGNAVFGNEKTYFVLSNDTRNNGAFSDLGFPGGGLTTGMRHIAIESGTADPASLSRPARTLNGYASGLVEGFSFTGAYPINSRFGDGSSLSMTFDPTKNRFSARFQLSDNLSLSGTSSGGSVTVNNYDLYFGNGRSTYVDDERYAARGDTLNDSTADGAVISAASSSSLSDSGKLYLVASTVAPLNPTSTAIPSGVSLCSACDFIEWGWWGAMPTYQAGPDSGRQELVHMGTWVAGDIPTVADLPTSGTASYSGHAIGTVNAGSARYVAIGSFSMNYDFSQGSGTVSINNFDGQNLSSSPAGATSGPASFGGSVVSDVGSRSGTLNGAFVRGPNSDFDGAIGDFNLSDGGSYSASGIFLGKVTSGGGSL